MRGIFALNRRQGLLTCICLLTIFTGTVRADDCNTNGTDDATDIALSQSGDCNTNATPDECDVAYSPPLGGAVNWPVQGGPNALQVVDFDGDGNRDVVVANGFSGTLSILWGYGDGTFEPAYHLGLTDNPSDVAISDVDTNGLLDLIAPIPGQNSVAVIYQTSVRVFGNSTYISTAGIEPVSVAAADVDHDGRPEIAVACKTSQEIDYYHSVTPFLFLLTDVTTNTVDPQKMATGDFDEDGDADFALALFNSSTVVVAFGNGLGQFPLRSDVTVGATPIGLAVADVNTDGYDDLVTANFNGSGITVLTGDGTGSFTRNDYPGDALPLGVGVGDVDGDGLPDVVATSVVTNSVNLFRNSGGGFAFVGRVAVGNFPNGVGVGDFDGDLLNDVAAGNSNNGNVSVLLNTGLPSSDLNTNGMPDVCEIVVVNGDCNTNGTIDADDILLGNSPDCDENETPDECDLLDSIDVGQSTAVPIEDFLTASDTITILGGNIGSRYVADVDVELDIQHSWDSDLSITFEHGGATIFLVWFYGGGENFDFTRFNDEAFDSIYSGSPPFSGEYQPDESLGAFDGMNVAGPWTLHVEDAFAGNTGTLLSWRLFITLEPGDCNTNGTLDACDLNLGNSQDCNFNDRLDECEIAEQTEADCNTNGRPDSCDLNYPDYLTDCDTNGTLDICDLANFYPDCDTNGSIDSCELDCDTNGVKDICDVTFNAAPDCNNNGFPDACDLLGFINLAPRVGYNPTPNPFGNPGSSFVVPSDVDGDGDLDLVISNAFSQDIAVLFNDGVGVFSAPDNYLVGPFIGEIAVDDFDNTNGPDIAVVDGINSQVVLWANDGTGHYTANGTLAVGSEPRGLKAGDVNNDGDVDLVVANRNSGSVGVMLGNGDGTFAAMVSYAISGQPEALVLAKLDGDNFLDAAVTFPSSGPSHAILLNDGTGAFPAPAYWGGAANPATIIAADMDTDGFNDLVTSDIFNARLSVFTNDGVGGIAFVTYLPTGALPAGLAAGDLDGDGDNDLVSGEIGDNQISVYRNNGDYTFTRVLRAGISTWPNGITIALMNNDAKPDVSVTNANGPPVQAVTVHMNISQPALADANTNDVPDICEIGCATCKGDLTGDARHDGMDVQGFVECLFAGPGITSGCDCADMNGDTQIDATDLNMLVSKLLNDAPACP